MAVLTDQLAKKLDDHIIENFADIYTIEGELKSIEREHDLDQPDVIAALATCADVAAVQQRLIVRSPKALVKGLGAALERGSLRWTSELMTRALVAGATLEGDAPGPTPKKLPPFARPSRLPAPKTAAGKRVSPEELEALVREIAAAKPGTPPSTKLTASSLAELGRALALGWLSHGSDPKHAWAASAAAFFPDDATASDLGRMARELGPRVGQFKKAQILIEVLAAMNTRAALEALQELTKVRTGSVRKGATAALAAAAKRMEVSTDGLADRLIRDDAPVGKDFTKRLEQRMVTASPMSVLELVENILQRDAVRGAAKGVVFAARSGKKTTTFAVGDKKGAELVDVQGKTFVLPKDATIVVAHPLDLSRTDLAKWRERIERPPFPQLDRPTRVLASPQAMTKALSKELRDAGEVAERRLQGLLAIGWTRVAGQGGIASTFTRELDGLEVTIELDPGVYAGRGMSRPQRVTKVSARGKGSARAISEIARELGTLA